MKQAFFMKKQVSTVRVSSIGHFSRIIKEHYQKWGELTRKIEELKSTHVYAGKTNGVSDPKLAAHETDLEKTAFVLIVFSAMALEAYIYDYAARHLGDVFVKDHLDKMDTVSKWVIVPELVTGKPLPNRLQWHGRLKKLIQVRNSITHYKSWDPTVMPDARLWKKLEKWTNEIQETASQSVDLLSLLADKISEANPEETPWVQTYLS
jgi:hypothetical protein